jgi:hypothetical protein
MDLEANREVGKRREGVETGQKGAERAGKGRKGGRWTSQQYQHFDPIPAAINIFEHFLALSK